jgi:alpha-ribazole phosphatase
MRTVETRWWWIRHAPVVGPNDHIYGQRDLDADCSDRATFEALAARLPEDAFLVTSDLQRTMQTAAAIVEAGLRLPEGIRESALREQHLGAWQGMRRDEFAAQRNGVRVSWLAPAFERAPDGESFADVVARVAPAVTRLTAEHRGKNIVCVAHGGTIRAALAMALEVDPDTALGFSIANCSVTRLDHVELDGHGDMWRVVMVNQQPR